MRDFASILIYAPSWIGDAVMSLGAIRYLRGAYPKARVVVLARPWVADLYQCCEAVDGTLSYDSRGAHRGALGFLRAARELKEARFDLALLLPNAFRAAALVRASGIPERWGYATEGRGFLLTRPVPPAPRPFGRHQVFYYLDLLRSLGVPVGKPRYDLALTDAMSRRAADLLGRRGWHGRQERLVGIHAGATNSSSKRWLPERYAEVGARLAASHDARIVLFAGPEEADLAGEIASRLAPPRLMVAEGTSLGELMGLLGSLSVLLTNDSGPMHLASALGVPTVAVFGPTDERETGPLGPRAQVVRQPVECSPCLLRECPIDHRCMLQIEVAEVYQVAVGFLDKDTRAEGRTQAALP
ncbi:MAG: lipopolysaccharide heptosyltransferase II [Acidobacteriota bacterium]